jgi:hypothetical protein
MLLYRNATMEGFVVPKYLDRYDEFDAVLLDLYDAGKLTARSDVFDGIESAPGAVEALFTGSNQGKLMVRVAEQGALGPTPSTRNHSGGPDDPDQPCRSRDPRRPRRGRCARRAFDRAAQPTRAEGRRRPHPRQVLLARPTMHTWVQVTDHVMSPRPGDVLLSQQVGEIVESRLAGYNVGDMVTTFGGLQDSVVRSTPRRRPRWR